MDKDIFFRESRLRSLTKAFIYRLAAIIGTGILVWLITKDAEKTISITAIVQVFLIILYYFNERIWNKINWERKVEKE